MRRAMDRILAPLYDVTMADGAVQALDRLAEDPFEVALVDIRLGDGDGYALCEEIRRRSPETDVILITGSISQPDEKLYRSLEGDAFYFLFKPFERRVLRALVERCLRLQRERRAKEEYAAALAEDLERAKHFQHSLQPSAPLEAAGWRIEGLFLPCDAVGGDFWMALLERDGSAVVALADIVGHGVSAAMYAGMLRSTLDAARRSDPMPDQVQKALVQGIDFFEASRFASLFYGHLGVDGEVGYFSAGHPPGLWVKAKGGIEELASTGLLLMNVFRTQSRTVETRTFVPGDRLFLYSDGASEAMSPAQEELGVEGLTEALEETRRSSLADALETIRARILAHAAGRPIEDDVTLVLVERL